MGGPRPARARARARCGLARGLAASFTPVRAHVLDARLGQRLGGHGARRRRRWCAAPRPTSAAGRRPRSARSPPRSWGSRSRTSSPWAATATSRRAPAPRRPRASSSCRAMPCSRRRASCAVTWSRQAAELLEAGAGRHRAGRRPRLRARRADRAPCARRGRARRCRRRGGPCRCSRSTTRPRRPPSIRAPGRASRSTTTRSAPRRSRSRSTRRRARRA